MRINKGRIKEIKLNSILKFKISIILLGVMLIFVSSNSVIAKEKEPDVVTGEMIIVYDDATLSEKKSQALQNEVLSEVEQKKDISIGEVTTIENGEEGTTAVVELQEDVSVEEIVELVNEMDGVLYAQPNYVYHLSEEVATESAIESILNDQFASACYHLDAMNIPKAWEFVKTNKKVAVAVVDTGCRLNHEDLKNNIRMDLACDVYETLKMKPATEVYDYKTVNWIYLKDRLAKGFSGDGDGHGTLVSSMISAEANNGLGVAGTSYNAELIPVKVFDDVGRGGSTVTIAKALDYLRGCIENGRVQNLRVVNISAGAALEEDLVLETAIANLRKLGVLTVCSAGNIEGSITATGKVLPSDFKEVLSVTATDKDNEMTTFVDEGKTLASYSCYNQYKDIAAPGTKIHGAKCTGDHLYTLDSKGYSMPVSGTSFAAPNVAGICALVWANNPNLSVAEVVEAVKVSSTPFSKQHDEKYTIDHSAGVVDAAAAVQYQPGSKAYDLGKYGEASIKNGVTFQYTGQRIVPEISMFGDDLVEGEDYVLEFTGDPLGVGKVIATAKGIGKYTGSLIIDYSIKMSLTQKIVTKEAETGKETEVDALKKYVTTSYYDGSEKKPKVTLKWRLDESKELEEGKDFDVLSYSNNIHAGDSKKGIYSTVKVVGRGFYTGSMTLKFYIKPRTFTEVVKPNHTEYSYTGKIIALKLIDEEIGQKLVEGKDYIVEKYVKGDGKVPGNQVATISGIGDFTGSIDISYQIKPADIDNVKLSSRSYTGNKVMPIVKLGDMTLKKDVDYQVLAIKNNKAIGTATVKLKGMNHIVGTGTRTFKIVPKKTKITKVTGLKKAFKVYWKKYSSNLTGYQIQFSSVKNFVAGKTKTVKVADKRAVSKKITKRASKKKYYVRVRAYKKVSGKVYYSSWSNVVSVKTK